METEFWTARLDRPLTSWEDAALTSLLPPERRARLERTNPADGRREALCAYGLLLLALRERHGLRAFPAVARTENGKPYFPELPGLYFSLSHTEGAVLAGLADIPLGVDIQRVRPVRETLARRMAAPVEPEAFFRVWTRREAMSKRAGDTLAALLAPETAEGIVCVPLETFPGFAACAAADAAVDPARLIRLTQSELLCRLNP